MNVILLDIDGTRVDRINQFENLKNFFDNGTFFDNMTIYAPYTIASMHAIFSGLYGNKNGVDNYYGGLDFKSDMCKTLTEYLKEYGYYTWGDYADKILVPGKGFDKITIHNEYKEDLLKRHIGILTKISKSKKKFFLFLQYSGVHTHLVKNVIKKYDDLDKEYFKNIKKNLKNYDNSLYKGSVYFKKIMDRCRELGLLKDTLFIVFSDHGASVGEKLGEKVYGSYCYDYTIRSFVCFYYPKLFKKQKISSQIRSIDIAPTVLDILGIEESLGYLKMDGKSLIPLIKGREEEERIAFSETGGLGGLYPSPKKPNIKSIRTNKWKLIYNTTKKSKELYNLKEDPSEQNNFILKKKDIANKLWKLMKEYV